MNISHSQVNFDFDQKFLDQRMKFCTVVSESKLSKSGKGAIRLAYLVNSLCFSLRHTQKIKFLLQQSL